MYSFDDEKTLREARKRDFLRSRLPAGRRWKAQDEAEEITANTTEDQKRRQSRRNRKDRDSVYDNAMETATQGCHRDKSIKQFII